MHKLGFGILWLFTFLLAALRPGDRWLLDTSYYLF